MQNHHWLRRARSHGWLTARLALPLDIQTHLHVDCIKLVKMKILTLFAVILLIVSQLCLAHVLDVWITQASQGASLAQ